MDDQLVETVARVCHEANRAYCVTLGDDSQPSWDDAPEWQRESARKGVRFHVANPDSHPSGSHTSWLAEKRADGWSYGPTKDVDAKQHPCMVPFEDLPPEQQMKDYIFTATVAAFLLGPLVEVRA